MVNRLLPKLPGTMIDSNFEPINFAVPVLPEAGNGSAPQAGPLVRPPAERKKVRVPVDAVYTTDDTGQPIIDTRYPYRYKEIFEDEQADFMPDRSQPVEFTPERPNPIGYAIEQLPEATRGPASFLALPYAIGEMAYNASQEKLAEQAPDLAKPIDEIVDKLGWEYAPLALLAKNVGHLYTAPWALGEGAYHAAKSGYETARDYFKGAPVNDRSLNQAAFDVASMAPLGVAGTKAATNVVGRSADTGDLGVFAGRSAARNFHQAGRPGPQMALDLADALEKAGFTPDEIALSATDALRAVAPEFGGVSKAADGQWRFEIDDSASKIRPEYDFAGGTPAPFREVLDHPDLLDVAYPELGDAMTSAQFADSRSGMFAPDIDPLTGERFVAGITANGPNEVSARNVLLHEGQHGAQFMENFAPGTTPMTFFDNPELQTRHFQPALNQAAYREFGTNFNNLPRSTQKDMAQSISRQLYENTAGEVEARNVERRADMSPEERGITPPELTEPVPRRSQVLFSYDDLLANGEDAGIVSAAMAAGREIDSRGFYSPSLEAAKGLKQERGTVQQMKSQILKAGAKPKELDAVGFDRAFPDGNAKVTRKEIEDFLRANRVELGEAGSTTHLSKNEQIAKGMRPTRFESYSTPGGIPGSYREVLTTLRGVGDPDLVKPTDAAAAKYKTEWDRLNAELAAIPFGDETQAARYRDLSAQREALHQRMVQDTIDQSPAWMPRGEGYKSSHWPGVTNPLLHYRTKDFPGAEGSKTRLLDELQSDWGQRARDRGVLDPESVAPMKAELDAARERMFALDRQIQKIETDKILEELGDGPDGSPFAIQRAINDPDHPLNAQLKSMQDQIIALKNERSQIRNTMMDLDNKIRAAESLGVPSAPFISNTSDWVDLGLKQNLIEAARDPSVTKLAWTPGDVQAQRYGMENHLSEMTAVRSDDGGVAIWPYDSSGRQFGNMIVRPDGIITKHAAEYGNIAGHHLSEVLGKELAEKALNFEGRETRLSGSDLRIGGEGHKKFYGTMSPEGYQSGIVGTRLQKLVKGLDPEAAKIGAFGLRQGSQEVARSLYTGMREAQEGLRSQQANQLVGDIEKIVFREGPEALRDYDAPHGFEKAWARGIEIVEEANRNGAFTLNYPSIEITPALRQKILDEGLSLFANKEDLALVTSIVAGAEGDVAAMPGARLNMTPFYGEDVGPKGRISPETMERFSDVRSGLPGSPTAEGRFNQNVGALLQEGVADKQTWAYYRKQILSRGGKKARDIDAADKAFKKDQVISKEELARFLDERAPVMMVERYREDKYGGSRAASLLDEENLGDGEIQRTYEAPDGSIFIATLDEDAGNVSVQRHGAGNQGWLDIDAPTNRQSWNDAEDAMQQWFEDRVGPEAQWQDYAIKGGDDYREVAVGYPDRDTGTPSSVGSFQDEAHMPHSNLEGWYRGQDFKRDGGEKITHLDEVQPQRYEKMRDAGEKPRPEQVQDWARLQRASQENLHNVKLDLARAVAPFRNSLPDFVRDGTVREQADWVLRAYKNNPLAERAEMIASIENLNAEFDKFRNEANHYGSLIGAAKEGVESSPYTGSINDATDHIVKQALVDAAKAKDRPGRLSWNTGDKVADMMGIQQHVSKIDVVANPGGVGGDNFSRSARVHDTYGRLIGRLDVDDNGVVVGGSRDDFPGMEGKRLEEVVGKDMARKIMEVDVSKADSTWPPVAEFRGDDLKIGGEGMRGYYGTIEDGRSTSPGILGERIQSQLEKVGQKNARVEPVRLDDGVRPRVVDPEGIPPYDAQSVRLDPDTLDKIRTIGLSLYANSDEMALVSAIMAAAEKESSNPKVRAAQKRAADVPFEDKLAVQHNMRGTSFAHNMRSYDGNIPVPSLAISKAGQPLTSFGDISLFGDPSMAIPKGSNPVYPADAYTKRAPKIVRDVPKSADRDRMVEKLTGQKGKGYTLNLDDPYWDTNFRVGYLRSKGLTPPEGMALDDWARNAIGYGERDAMEAFVNDFLDSHRGIIRERIDQGWSNDGERRLYKPHTLDNMVKASKGKAGTEDFDYGPTSWRAHVMSPFKSLAEIQEGRGLINRISKEEVDALKEGLAEKGFRLAEAMGYRDTYSDMVLDGLRSPDPEVRNLAKELRDDLAKLPTEYFEGKPQRAVGLDEFKLAAVPETMPDVARDLDKMGLDVRTYDRSKMGEDGAPITEILRTRPDLLFSNDERAAIPGAAVAGGSGELPLVGGENPADYSVRRLYHGTSNAFDEFNPGRRPLYLTDDPSIAEIYANIRSDEGGKRHAQYTGEAVNGGPNILPVDVASKRTLTVSDRGPDGSYGWSGDNIAAALGIDMPPAGRYSDLHKEAALQGYDMLEIQDMMDLGGEQSQYIPLMRGTVKSATTGETLFANPAEMSLSAFSQMMGQLIDDDEPDYGNRADGTPKGSGYFGELERPDGSVSTELSIGVDLGDGEMQIPLLVPTLSSEEVYFLTNSDAALDPSQIPQQILDKAIEHAIQRMNQGLSPFAD